MTDPISQADKRADATKNGGTMLTWKNGVNFIVYSIALVSATVAVMQWALIRDVKQDILEINNRIIEVTDSFKADILSTNNTQKATQRQVDDIDTTVKLLQASINYQLVALNQGQARMEATLKEHIK